MKFIHIIYMHNKQVREHLVDWNKVSVKQEL